MRLERYCDTHAPELQRLLGQHNLPLVAVPKLGFAVMHAEHVAAMGFLRSVEGGSYIFDSLVSDPELNSEQRHEAMSLLWASIIKEANGAPILGFSINDGTVSRALASGFEAVAYTVLVHKG